MKTKLLWFLGMVGFLGGMSVATVNGQAPGNAVPDQYIVQVQGGANAAAVAARHGLAPRFVYSAAINGFAGFIPPGLLRRVQTDPQVVSVVPDRVVSAIAQPGATGKPGTGGGGTTGQVVPLGVNRIGAAPGALSVNGEGVGVAIVDTGIDLVHADLEPVESGFSAFGGSAQDNNGHGTHVAGTVAARANTTGVVGVAPGATLYPVKVLDASGSGSDASVIAGLNWVAANAAAIRVVNMSLGRPASADDSAMRTAVQSLSSARITVVVAAGNDCALEVSQQVPAGFPEVLAVASTTAAKGTSADARYAPIVVDSPSYFTTDGLYTGDAEASPPIPGIGVTISAPGEDQENIRKGGFLQSVGILSTKLGGGTTRMSGTSMAAPHVTGVVALLYQASGSLTPDDARKLLRIGADRPGSAPVDGRTSCYSFDGEREGVLWAPGALAPLTVPQP